jgi:hypothetical protein
MIPFHRICEINYDTATWTPPPGEEKAQGPLGIRTKM